MKLYLIIYILNYKMYQKPYHSNIGNPYLQINCSMDMDSMEITKTKAIKKYEENSYLLGRIFELRDNIPAQKTGNNKISTPENKTLKKNIDDLDIIELFDDKIDDGYYDSEEKIDLTLREFTKMFDDNKWEDKTILNKLIDVNTIYKKEEDFQDKEKLEIEKLSKKFENILNSLKNMKTGELVKDDIINLVNQCKEEGFIDEKTLNNFNQFMENYIKCENDKTNDGEEVDLIKDKNDKNKFGIENKMIIEDVEISSDEKDIPFNHSEKIITFPL